MKLKSFLSFTLLLPCSVAYSQDLTVASTNGSTSTFDLSSLRSIVFTNNNLVVKTTECQDNYFSIFFTEEINFNEALGLEPGETIPSMLVYPNPASELITVEIPGAANGSFILSNIQGAKIMTAFLSGQKTSLDITQLPSGVYFISYEQQLVKFIKQ